MPSFFVMQASLVLFFSSTSQYILSLRSHPTEISKKLKNGPSFQLLSLFNNLLNFDGNSRDYTDTEFGE